MIRFQSFLLLISLSTLSYSIESDLPVLNGTTIGADSTSPLSEGNLDLDGDQRYDALTDGLLILRSMFGLTGDALISGVLSDSAAYSSSAEIESRFDHLESLLDVDDNGIVDALTDGLLILRYLFGLSGDNLISNVTATDAQRSNAYQISSYVGQLASLNINACSNSPVRFYQVTNLANDVSYSLEGEDKGFFEISSDGFLSFKNTVPSSSNDGDDIFAVGIKQEGSSVDDEIRWLSITLVPGYAVEVMQLFPGNNSLLRVTGNKLIAKGILYSPSREITKDDISDLSVNSIMVTDIEEINGEIYWSVELNNNTTSVALNASTKCGNITDSYLFSQDEADAVNPIGDFILDEENNRIFAVNRLIPDHYYVAYDLTTSALTGFVQRSKIEEFVSRRGYSLSPFTLHPASGDILSYRITPTGFTVFRTNINSDEITAMEQAFLFANNSGRILPIMSTTGLTTWMMNGLVTDAEGRGFSGLLTVRVDQNVRNYFYVSSSRQWPGNPIISGFLVDPLDTSNIFLAENLPDVIKPFVTRGETIQHINGVRYFSYETQDKVMLYNVDTSEQTVLIDFIENPFPVLPRINSIYTRIQISSDGNSVYFSGGKFIVFDVLTQKYNVILGGIGDPDHGLQGRIGTDIVLANNNKTLVSTYGYCDTFGGKKIAAVELKTGTIIYDRFLDCDSGNVIEGYNTENKILLADKNKLVSLDLNDGNKTTLVTLPESILAVDFDDKDSKLYLLDSSHLYIFDMNTKAVIASRGFVDTPLGAYGLYPERIKKNTASSAIYVGQSGAVYEFKEDSLDSEPIKIIESSTEISLETNNMEYSKASNSLYFGIVADETNQLGILNLDSLILTTQETHAYLFGKQDFYDDLVLDDNLGFIYFRQASELNVYDIKANQSSLIMN